MSKFLTNKYVKSFLFMAVIALAFTAVSALAQSSGGEGGSGEVFSTIKEKMTNTFQNIRTIVFVVGGFGLIGLGVAAIFGKIKWPWLAALACGLAIVAVASALVNFVTHTSTEQPIDDTIDFQDTLDNSGS